MKSELDRRKQACELYDDQKKRKAAIISELGCSRPWLARWLGRYEADRVEESLSNEPVGSKPGPRGGASEIHQQVLEMRRLRSDQQPQP